MQRRRPMGDQSQAGKRPLTSPESAPTELKKKMPNLARSPKQQQLTKENPVQEMKQPMDTDENGLLAQIGKLLDGQTKVLNEAIKSVNETVDLKFRDLEKKIVEVETVNKELQLKNANLEARMLFLEREGRKNSIVISGLKAKDAKDGKEQFESMVTKTTGTNIALKNYRLINGGNRLVATCSDWEDKMIVMACKKNLKNQDQTPIYVDNDLPKEDRDVQSRIRSYAREYRKKGTAVQVGFRKVKIDGVWTPYEDLEKLDNEHTFRKEQPDSLLERPGIAEESQRD